MRFFIFILFITKVLYKQNTPYYQTQPPYLQNFTADQYKAHHQNWAVIQDHRRVIYTANRTSLLKYKIKRPNTPVPNSLVKALSIDKTNTICISRYNQIGYLDKSKRSILHYVSVLPNLNSIYHNFANEFVYHFK